MSQSGGPGPAGRDAADSFGEERAGMGRWRPAERPGSKYSTPEGAARLRSELDQLWRSERPQVTQAVAEAAAQGDRSENAEYTYGKKRLREIDRRVRFLRKRLDGIVIVSAPPADRQRVFFGAWVELQDQAGGRREHRVVGPDEFDLDPRYLSMDAPLGRMLLGRRLGEELTVRLPAGERVYTIVGIRYQAAAE
jgi:transcription elongation factor GreB